MKDILINKHTGKIARFLFYLTGSTINVTGIEKIPDGQQVLFVSNHQSHMDSIIIHGFIDIHKGLMNSCLQYRNITFVSVL
jgi:1-acyl-sn-glycerol-3-phosphate acyltransferase